MDKFSKIIAKTLDLPEQGVESTLKLLDDNCTIPFISRYRKESTGNLDEVKVSMISQMKDKLDDILKRKETVISTIDGLGKMTSELRSRIDDCWNMSELEDLYLPYKPKRHTKAEIARLHGLEPLAKTLLQQRELYPYKLASQYVNGEVKSEEDAIMGAKYIIAEKISEDEFIRRNIRNVYKRDAIIISKVVKAKADDVDAQKYFDYFEFSESLKRCSSHRLLAIRRGEREGFLKVTITANDDICCDIIRNKYVFGHHPSSAIVADAALDAFKRLIKPSIENEFASISKENADKQAICVFSENLRQLLLAAPLGQKRVLGVDPGFRTGCKVVCLDAQGKLLHYETIFPHAPHYKIESATRQIKQMVQLYKIESIAIGNGTASRETDAFFKTIGLNGIHIYMVSEDGASVYSASDIAREEFPDCDLTIRGAVSIGRRLMDPLAELVKIDPKSIGVGQYQHDVDQQLLKRNLDNVVESCVNSVGVNLNTASRYLLMYVSGLNATTAKNIVEYRNEHGPFRSRTELKKVPRLGPVAFVQCAGFLRVPNGNNPLDNTAVHPESYDIVRQMAMDCGCDVTTLISDKNLQKSINLQKYVSKSVGMPTLNDIISELQRPGRDPRPEIEDFEFASDIHKVEDLKMGMILPGIVTNITNFGVFVDVGVHQDGLVHISQLSNKFVTDANEVVNLHEHVMVKVMNVDTKRSRISLTMKDL